MGAHNKRKMRAKERAVQAGAVRLPEEEPTNGLADTLAMGVLQALPNGREVEAGIAVETCVHHWKIAMPNGAASSARCRNCGAAKMFSNVYMEKTRWEKSAKTMTPTQRDKEIEKLNAELAKLRGSK